MSEGYYTVDRFEGEFCILMDSTGVVYEVQLNTLPPDIKEGDLLGFDGTVFSIDTEATAKRSADMQGRLRKLFTRREQNTDSTD